MRDSQSEKNEMIASLEKMVSEQQQALELQDGRLSNVEEHYDSTNALLRKTQSELDQTRELLKNLITEKDSELLPELEKAQKAKSDLQAKLALIEEDLTILKQNLEVLVQENERKTDVCQQLKAEISEKEVHAQNLKKQKENVSELCQLAQRENLELADNLDAKELHNENLKKEIDGLESALEFSKSAIADFQADVTNKAALLEVTERECQKLNEMIGVNSNQLSELVKELSHKDASYHEIMEVNTNLDSEVRELRMREETYSCRQMS